MHRRRGKIKIVSLLFFLGLGLWEGELVAQRSVTDKGRTEHLYREGMKLYRANNYHAARTFFLDYLSDAPVTHQEEAEYCLLVCNLSLNKSGATAAAEKFLEKKYAVSVDDILPLQLGRHYFKKADYARAALYLSVCVDGAYQKDEEFGEIYYKYAYSLMEQGELEEAKRFFEQSKAIDSPYAQAAFYYYAHILYMEGIYPEAKEAFLALEQDPQYGEKIYHYLAQLFFIEEDYAKSYDYAQKVLDIGAYRQDKMLRIAGVSSYFLEDYDEAVRLLSQLEKQDDVEPVYLYYLGLAHYEEGDWKAVLNCLDGLLVSDSVMMQGIDLLLGHCFTRLKYDKKAYEAFLRAGAKNFKPQVQEEASYHAIRMGCGLSDINKKEVLALVDTFYRQFPLSKHCSELQVMEAQMLLELKEFEQAYQKVLDADEGSDVDNLLQQSSYYTGAQHLSQGKFSSAIDYFSKSLADQGKSERLKARALYWRGEAYFREGKFSRATGGYMEFLAHPLASKLREYVLVYFGLGHCAFYQSSYKQAIAYFERYLELGFDKESKERITTVYNRLGDSFFAERLFIDALSAYEYVVNANCAGVDHALFQQANIYGLQKDLKLKIKCLQSLVENTPESAYCDDAYWELGNVFVLQGEYERGIAYYHNLLVNCKGSELESKALLQIGLAYYNLNRLEEAYKYYEAVVEDYPKSEEAGMALKNLGNLSVESNTVEKHIAYVHTIDNRDLTLAVDEEELRFRSAEKMFFGGNYPVAINYFTKYLEHYPQGAYRVDVMYYRAVCYRREGNIPSAIEDYNYVLQGSDNEHTREALWELSELYFAERSWTQALPLLTRLLEMPLTADQRRKVSFRRVACAYATGLWEEVVAQASDLTEAGLLENGDRRTVLFWKAQSLMALNKFEDARACFEVLETNLQDTIGAESHYRVSQYLYEKGGDKQAEAHILGMVEKGTPHDKWKVRSLLLLTDIYVKQKRFLEAQGYLEVIQLKHATDADCLKEVEERLLQIHEKPKDDYDVPSHKEEKKID